MLYPVLFIADFFQPGHWTAIERFRYGDMCHGIVGSRAVPMFDVHRDPDNIALIHFFNLSAPFLKPTPALGNDERLTQWVRMPGSTGAGFKRDGGAADPGGFGGLKRRINSDVAGKIIFRAGL